MCLKEYFTEHKFKEMLLRLKIVPNFKKIFNILSCLMKLKGKNANQSALNVYLVLI